MSGYKDDERLMVIAVFALARRLSAYHDKEALRQRLSDAIEWCINTRRFHYLSVFYLLRAEIFRNSRTSLEDRTKLRDSFPHLFYYYMRVEEATTGRAQVAGIGGELRIRQGDVVERNTDFPGRDSVSASCRALELDEDAFTTSDWSFVSALTLPALLELAKVP